MATARELLQIVITADSRGAVTQINQVGAAADKNLTSVQSKTQRVGDIFLKTGAVMAVGFGLAVAATVKFDKAMSEVAAVSGATGRQLGELRQAAIDAGRDTAFSATEAATAIGELSKAGVSTADILGGGLRGALDLAAAGQIELAEAATIAAQAMNIFGLSGRDVGRVADVLAAGANKSAADMEDLGQALRQGGLLAKQTGLDLEDTVGVLSLFADNALIGSDAGTSLKTMLQRLTPQSAEAAAEMERLGISAYDSQGQFVGLEKFAGNLRNSLKGLTPEARNVALAVIFGSDATRAAGIIYDAGAKGIREYVNAVDDQGAAAETAAKKMDNLAGDLERLKGSIETVLIGTGSQGTGVLREMVQGVDGLLNAFSSLPAPIQTAAQSFFAFGGAALLVSGAVIKLGPGAIAAANGLRAATVWTTSFGVAAAGTAVEVTALTAANLRLAASGGASVGAALASATTGLTSVATGAVAAVGGLVLLGPALDAVGLDAETAAERFDRHVKSQQKMIESSKRSAESIRAEMRTVRVERDAALKRYDELPVSGAGDMIRNFFRTDQTEKEQAFSDAERFSERLKALKGALAGTPEGLGKAARAQGEFNQKVQQAAAPLQTQLAGLQGIINTSLGYEGALRAQAAAVDAVAEAYREYGAGSREVSEAEFQLKQSIAATAEAARARAVEQAGPNASAEAKAKAGLDAYRQSLNDAANSNIPSVRAQALLLLSALNDAARPRQGSIDIDTSRAEARLASLRRAYEAFGRSIVPGAYGPAGNYGGGIDGNPATPYTMGGYVGAARGQSVPAFLHGGEYVLSADVVDRIKRGAPSRGAAAPRPGTWNGAGGGSVQAIYLTVQSLDPRQAGPLVVDALAGYARKNGTGGLKKVVGV